MCNTCMSIIKQKLVEMAIHTNTPFIVFAFSPGQTEVPFVTLTRPFMTWIRKLFDGQLKTMGVLERDLYLMDQDIIAASPPDTEVMIVHPFLIWDYNKHQFREECIRLGWKEPDINDPNSSNCLLNAYAIKNHFDKYHIHSYAYDLSALVRRGNITKEEATKTLNAEFSDAALQEVHKQTQCIILLFFLKKGKFFTDYIRTKTNHHFTWRHENPPSRDGSPPQGLSEARRGSRFFLFCSSFNPPRGRPVGGGGTHHI